MAFISWMLGQKAPALRQRHGMRITRGRSRPIFAPAMAIRLCRMRSSVSRTTFTSCFSSRSKCSSTEPARLFSMGIAAASAAPESSAANTSAESAQGTISAPGDKLQRRFVAERAGLSLNGDLHSVVAGLSCVAIGLSSCAGLCCSYLASYHSRIRLPIADEHLSSPCAGTDSLRRKNMISLDAPS